MNSRNAAGGSSFGSFNNLEDAEGTYLIIKSN
jgi:hypothetical protein